MNSFKTIPITLVTGYLGSGKTTLLNHILSNKKGYKIAVIVNDIGEVNIDADLIEKGGVVNKREESLVALQNGCICCTLRQDLIEQIHDIVKQHKFDHIVIEASGICEPVPIAQTINFLTESFKQKNMPIYCKLDAVVSVVDSLRMVDEFGSGSRLNKKELQEDDIENLVIQQIEFCNILVLNKTNEINADQLKQIKQIVKNLQPKAKLIETNYSKVDLDEILDTNLFDMEDVLTSAGWYQEIEKDIDEDDQETHNHHEKEHYHEHHHEHDDNDHHDDENEHNEDHEHHEHEHHHGHCHCHENGEECHCHEEGHAHGEEYGIETFVYFRRKPFDRLKFEDWVNSNPYKIIRTKGLIYFENEYDLSYIYEQAGRQKQLTENGKWYATLPKSQINQILTMDEKFRKDWDDTYGDRMIKLVFIGQKFDKNQIISELDKI